MAAEVETIALEWVAQPRQIKFLRACGLSYPFDGGEPRPAVAKAIGFGGAAGGGKSDALVMLAIILCITFPGIKVGYFRRNFKQLEGPGGAIMRSMELIKHLGIATYNQSSHRWTFAVESIWQFCHIEHENSVHDYHSQQFDVILFDEATQFTRSMVRYMFTRNRATIDYPNFRPFVAMGTNPGDIGHGWFKEQFVELGDPEIPHLCEIEEGKFETHIFIPSKLSDNKVLEERDPEYRKNLENQAEHIRRMLLDGDWDVGEGLAFSEFRKHIHLIDPLWIPEEWPRIRSLDWGYSKPYHVGWYAIDFDGRMYMYRELYGWGGRPNEGSREGPEDVAKKIAEVEDEDENIVDAVADDAIWGSKQDNSPDIAEQFNRALQKLKRKTWRPVGKGKGSRKSGKLEVHARLKWRKDTSGTWTGELPMLVFVRDTTPHIVRTLPNLIVDPLNLEDIETKIQEDHPYDSVRYACMSRPMLPKKKKPDGNLFQQHKQELAKKMAQSKRRAVR